MKLRGVVTGLMLTLSVLLVGGCQSASKPEPTESSSDLQEQLKSVEQSSAEIERLLALIKELDELKEDGEKATFPELDARKQRASNSMSVLLLAACLQVGEDISKISDDSMPPCVFKRLAELIDPSGAASKHCGEYEAVESFINCAAGGTMIARIKEYRHQQASSADWSGDERHINEAARELGKYVIEDCMKVASGLANCVVEKTATALVVPPADVAYCQKQKSLMNKLDCVGYAAALALFETGVASGS